MERRINRVVSLGSFDSRCPKDGFPAIAFGIFEPNRRRQQRLIRDGRPNEVLLFLLEFVTFGAEHKGRGICWVGFAFQCEPERLFVLARYEHEVREGVNAAGREAR